MANGGKCFPSAEAAGRALTSKSSEIPGVFGNRRVFSWLRVLDLTVPSQMIASYGSLIANALLGFRDL